MGGSERGRVRGMECNREEVQERWRIEEKKEGGSKRVSEGGRIKEREIKKKRRMEQFKQIRSYT